MKISELQKLLVNNGLPATSQEQEQIHMQLRAMGIEPGEYYQELEMDNVFVTTYRDVSFSNAAIHLHSHKFYELLCCCNTCGAEYMVGTRRYRIQKGDILLVAPGVSHRPILPEKMTEPYQRDVLWLSKEYVEMLKEYTPEAQEEWNTDISLIRTAGTKWEFLEDLFREGVREAENREVGWEMAVLGNTSLIVTQLYRALRYQTARKIWAEAPELLDRVMGYIEKHLAEKITLGETARHFYVSESTISHLFRQKLGVSFYRCVTQRRLIAAKELIWQGVAMDAVSEKVGFTDYSSFYRAFKQEYSISPQQYRKLQGIGVER